MTGATSVLPSARAIRLAAYSMTNLCSPSTMWGPFCSVPAVPMMTVVVPAFTMSRTSAHVRSSMNTVSGALPADAVSGALAGLCAETVTSGNSSRTTSDVGRATLFIAGSWAGEDYTMDSHEGSFHFRDRSKADSVECSPQQVVLVVRPIVRNQR